MAGHRGSIAAFALAVGLVAVAAGLRQPPSATTTESPYLVVLGVTQDGGAPQAGCRRECCEGVWSGQAERRHVACVALVDPLSGERWMFDATPDFREQLRMLDEIAPPSAGARAPDLAGIFLTHAHIGHYTGLMFLGHESIGADEVPVFVMPRMRTFLTNNGPWRQLVDYDNIKLRPIMDGRPVRLNDRLFVTPMRVPHREEFSEVVGYRIQGPNASALFIPDIDKWEKWTERLETMLLTADVAYVDGTFYSDGEIPGRDMSTFPHPFISETIDRLRLQNEDLRRRVRFIHLNHTNPALRADSEARRTIEAAGMRVAEERDRFGL